MSQNETMPRENNLFRSETAWIQLFVTTMANDLLLYNNSYWQEKLGPEFRKNNHENKLHLIFSLLVFLEISLAQFLTFTFSSKIEKVKSRASRFMGYTETANDENTRFPPRAIWHMWLENFPRCKLHIYEMIRPVACEIALGESDKIVEDQELQVKMRDLTIASIRDLLQPQKIVEKYQKLAPFTWAVRARFQRPVVFVVSSLMTRASMPFAIACSAWKTVSATQINEKGE